MSIPGSISCFEHEDVTQPFRVSESITGRDVRFTLYGTDGTTVLAALTTADGVTITSDTTCDVVISATLSDRAPGRYPWVLSFGEVDDRVALADGQLTISGPRLP